MGERFQFYIVIEDNNWDREEIIAIHDQWIYGSIAVKYTDLLIEILDLTDWGNQSRYELNNYIKAILSVRFHSNPKDNKNKYFYHRVNIEDMGYAPDSADTNHGCVIIKVKIEDKKTTDIKASFFDENGTFIPVTTMNKSCETEPIIANDNLSVRIYDRLNERDYEKLCREMLKRHEEEEKKK